MNKSTISRGKAALVAVLAVCMLTTIAVAPQLQEETEANVGAGVAFLGVLTAGAIIGFVLNDYLDDRTTDLPTDEEALEEHQRIALGNAMNSAKVALTNDMTMANFVVTHWSQIASVESAIIFNAGDEYDEMTAMRKVAADLLTVSGASTDYYSEIIRVFWSDQITGHEAMTVDDGNWYYHSDREATTYLASVYDHRDLEFRYAVSGPVWLKAGENLNLRYYDTDGEDFALGRVKSITSGSYITASGATSYNVPVTGIYDIEGLAFTKAAIAPLNDTNTSITPAIVMHESRPGGMVYPLIQYTFDDGEFYARGLWYKQSYEDPAVNQQDFRGVVDADDIHMTTAAAMSGHISDMLPPAPSDARLSMGTYLEQMQSRPEGLAPIYAAAEAAGRAYYDYMDEFGGYVPVLPTAVFIDPADLQTLSSEEYYAIYSAYLYHLDGWFEENSALTPSNISMSLDSVQLRINGTLYDEEGGVIAGPGAIFSIYITNHALNLSVGDNIPLGDHGFVMVWEETIPAFVPIITGMKADIDGMTQAGDDIENITLTPSSLEYVLLQLQDGVPFVGEQLTLEDLLIVYWWIFAAAAAACVLFVALWTRIPLFLYIGGGLAIIAIAGYYISSTDWSTMVDGTVGGFLDWLLW